MRLRPFSLALRLTLLFGGATAIVLPAFGWLVIHSTERHFLIEDRSQLMVVANAVHKLLHEDPRSDTRRLQQRISNILVGHRDASLRLVAPDGDLLFASPEPDLASVAVPHRPDTVSVRQWQDQKRHYRVLGRSLSRADERGHYQITVAAPIDHHLKFLAEFRRTLWLMIAGSIALMSLMGWISVRQGHAPLHRIVARIRRIRIGQLNTRLDPDSVPAELTELAVSFNELLDRVDRAFRRLSEFNADIAHELRTPIANLMTQTQVALSRTRTAEEYREILYSSMEEYERMAQMVADMLYLAKADSQSGLQRLDVMDLAGEVDTLVEYYEGWAEERGVTLRRNGDATVTADRLMIQRALGNLISNAIKNTDRGGRVTIYLDRPADSTVQIAVENTGKDIPREQWSRLFDRFYRTDESRQSRNQGVGLGLAIVKSIITAHRGDIAVRSGGGQTRFTVSLPTQPPAATTPDRGPSDSEVPSQSESDETVLPKTSD